MPHPGRPRDRARPSPRRSTPPAESRAAAEPWVACGGLLVGRRATIHPRRIRCMARRPNFLFIVTDQHRADLTGFGGNPVLRTPNLDRIAARGCVFQRAIVANPICMPNRSSIATGRVPSVHGTRYNGIPLDWGARTFMRALRARGWHNAQLGKCHLQNMGVFKHVRDALMRAALPGEANAERWPEGWDEWENLERHKR